MFSILSKFMILNLNFVWEAKPNCKGEPLKPGQFSNEGDVGFIKDVCVDIVARNLYNSLGFPVSQLCEELANMKTSTGSIKFLKWKRSSKRNIQATYEVMATAEALLEELLDVVATNMPMNTDEHVAEFLYGQTNDAKRRLIDSGAVFENPRIVDILEDLKIFLCKRCAMSDNKDMMDAVNQFLNPDPDLNGLNILSTNIEDTVVSRVTITGLFRLKFDVQDGTKKKAGSVILKIPSLAPFYNTKFKYIDLYLQEAIFYGKILPALYQMGKCEPFAPRAFVVTERYALILEDLSEKKYVSLPMSQSLDLDHSRIFLDVLAKYHALGYVYFQNLGEDDPIKQFIGRHQQKIRKVIDKEEFDKLCEMVKPFLSETLYQKILMAENEILAKLPLQNKNDKQIINVIMHGDLHRNNFLFKYDSDGKVSGVKLLDWQTSSVGSLVLDLIEFFIHNLDEEIFEANENYLLDYYIAKFNQNLSSVQSSCTYNRLELNQDIIFFKYYYFRVLSEIVINWDARESSANHEQIAMNIAKWLMYLDKNEYI